MNLKSESPAGGAVAAQPSDKAILGTAEYFFVTGENQREGKDFLWRSMGTPSNVYGADLIEFARAILKNFAAPQSVSPPPTAPTGEAWVEQNVSGNPALMQAMKNHAATPKATAPVAGEAVPLAKSRAGRVYLAGPMTGIADFNFPAFNAMAARLRAEGFQVVNPADHGVQEGAEWTDYLRYDLTKLAGCESIAVLPGWSESKGASLEVHIAQTLGMAVRRLDGAEEAATPRPASASTGAVMRRTLELIRDWPVRDSKTEAMSMRKLAHDTLASLPPQAQGGE